MTDTIQSEEVPFRIVFRPNTMRMITSLIPQDNAERFTSRGMQVEPYAPGGYRQKANDRLTVEPWPIGDDESETA